MFYKAGGNNKTKRTDIPIWQQGYIESTGVILEDDIWLGAGVTVLDGVKIGSHSIVGAGAVVTKPIEDRSVSMGIPAKVVKFR